MDRAVSAAPSGWIDALSGNSFSGFTADVVSTHTEPLSVREGGRGVGFIWGSRKAITNSLSHPNHVHGGFPWHTNSYSLILCVSLRVCVLSMWWIFTLNMTRKLQNTVNTQFFTLVYDMLRKRAPNYGLWFVWKIKWIAISNLVMLQNSYKINWDLKASPKSSLFKVASWQRGHLGHCEALLSVTLMSDTLEKKVCTRLVSSCWRFLIAWTYFQRGFTKNFFAVALVASRLLLLHIVCMAGANLSANSWRLLSK